ncbi:hypothetical protein GUITHDRAFT_104723 [Guillardia theta CCMP2712]|uniref:Mitochondrial carrier protein n=1 Tax=Guillardia theta (strain CCMP2712) TaxID=905079 RepID=L1JMT7_GUITC|nr:hypothetical protein GUITHDRAFT_104723 [Guillardia theta CCMP2712]EKX49757.1 hypothetical protein GUITHDRAFT_104723 [Guillardia theta CCMP2712]|eukprot:XP_005836737.1 hypothetical protein GUITHDRAFT_104723 [Guillardia theta CCMP2712]
MAAGGKEATLVGVPMECIKHRVQLGGGVLHTDKRNAVYNVVQWTTYPIALKLLSGERRELGSVPHWNQMQAGFLAGIATAFATQPLDTINTRLQTQNLKMASAQYAGIRNCAMTIIREEGVSALYRGVVPRAMNFGIGAACFFFMFEKINKALAS